tara:strand:+ start:1136 stop:1819 length:684 start_codon:yes stop_codon:yes gene_type:complete
MNFKLTEFPISIKSIQHLISQTFKNKSPLRIFHNFFLKTIKIKGKVIDLGSGDHSSYYNFLEQDNPDIYYADRNEPKTKKHYKVDLEKKLNFSDNEFDEIILFNVIEHVQNYKNLLGETFRILKKNGKLELFVPFMFRYHEDPQDFLRPTHHYITKILEKEGFEVKTYLIGVGPIKVISEIILRYFKFNFLRVFFLIILLFLDRFINYFSKDYKNYYCGIHCSCKKN